LKIRERAISYKRGIKGTGGAEMEIKTIGVVGQDRWEAVSQRLL
jgi:hypothetical protein